MSDREKNNTANNNDNYHDTQKHDEKHISQEDVSQKTMLSALNHRQSALIAARPQPEQFHREDLNVV